jgi:hypothetical protein
VQRPFEARFCFDQQAAVLTARFVAHSPLVGPPIHPRVEG